MRVKILLHSFFLFCLLFFADIKVKERKKAKQKE
jgi:hypothetical protein